MRTRVVIVAIAAVLGLALQACAVPTDSPKIQQKLKLVSAGHTGCLPDENVITNVVMSLNGDGQWNATCKGKT